jgi:uncharacterized protein (TIGR02594 family)
MAATSEDLARLLVQVELSQAKVEKQAAAIAKAAERSAKQIEGGYRAANTNVASGFARTSGQVTLSLNQQRAAATNLSFQLNDLVTQISGGTSPMRAFAQQAGQITQVLNGLGSRRAVFGALGGAIGSLLNPVGLATLAIGGLTAAAIDYFTSTESGGDEANKVLEEHRTAIRDALKEWEGAPAVLVEYLKQLDEIAIRNERLGALTGARDNILGPLRDQLPEISIGIADVTQRLMELGASHDQIRELQSAFADVEQKLVDGQAPTDELARLTKLLTQATDQYGNTLAAAVAGNLAAFTELLKEAAPAAERLNNAIADQTIRSSTGGRPRYQPGFLHLPNTAPTPEHRIDPYFADGPAPRASAADSAATRLAERTAKEAAERLTAAIATQSATAVDAAALLLNKHEGRNTGDINAFLKAGGVDLNAATTAWCAAFVNSALAQVGIQGSGSNVATDFLNWGNKVDPSQIQRGDVLVQDRGLGAGQVGGHVGFATGLVRFQEGIMQLQMLSGNASNKVQEDWVNAADVVARRSADAFQVPADALKHIGQQSETAKQAAEAHAAAVKQQEAAYQQLGNIASGALNGIANALADGKLEGEELLQIVLQIAQQLLTMPQGAGGLGGLLGGGGGGLLGGLLSLFGFDNGGYTGAGPKRKPAGIVHKGEVVFSQDDVRRSGGVAAVERLRKRGYMDGGAVGVSPVPAYVPTPRVPVAGGGQQAVHVTVGVSADGNGNLMPFVESVSQRTAAQTTRAGIAQYDKQLDRTMGGKMARAQTRQL